MNQVIPMLDVSDVNVSVAFYTEKLGFKHEVSMDGADGKTALAFVTTPGGIMIGLSRNTTPQLRGVGVNLMLYMAEDGDIDQYYADIQARGVVINSPIADQYWGDRTFALRDPDGYYLTIGKTTKQVSMDEIAVHMRST